MYRVLKKVYTAKQTLILQAGSVCVGGWGAAFHDRTSLFPGQQHLLRVHSAPNPEEVKQKRFHTVWKWVNVRTVPGKVWLFPHELKRDWESLSRTFNHEMADSWYWVLEQAAHTWACWQMEHSSRSGGAGLSWTPDPSSRRSRGGSTWRQHSVTTQENSSDFNCVVPDSMIT